MESAFESHLHCPKSSEINDAYFHMDTSHAATATSQTASGASGGRPHRSRAQYPDRYLGRAVAAAATPQVQQEDRHDESARYEQQGALTVSGCIYEMVEAY
jgi:hypothetical protein